MHMREAPPNILYLHSHDTGRFVQPCRQPVPTPNIQRLADQGVLFRNAFCATPTCSASRACLRTSRAAEQTPTP
jgi:arylsulfatase A-like enzyme